MRRTLVIVLTASGLKLLSVGNGVLLFVLACVLIVVPIVWAVVYQSSRRAEGGDRVAARWWRLWWKAATGRRPKQPAAQPAGIERESANR